MTPEELNNLIRQLQSAGSTGLDLSPGDPLCLAAAQQLKLYRTQLIVANAIKDVLDEAQRVCELPVVTIGCVVRLRAKGKALYELQQKVLGS